MIGFIFIAWLCRTNPWPAIQHWTLMPDYRKKCRCRTNCSPAFRHLHKIFQYYIARITPSAAVYGLEWITFHYLQFVRALRIPFFTNTSSMDEPAGCIQFHNQQYGRAGCLPFHRQQYGRAGCLPFHSQQYACAGSLPFPPPAVCTCRVYPFPQPTVLTCSAYSFPLRSVWTCRVCPIPQPAEQYGCACRESPFHRQQYVRAGCIHFHSQQCIHVQGVSLESDCPASGQSGTGMNKNAEAGTSPVSE